MSNFSLDLGEEHNALLEYLIAKGQFPSFDEYARNPEQYKGRADEVFMTSEDGASGGLRKQIRKQTYAWKDVYTNIPIEKVESIMLEEGFHYAEVDIVPIKKNVVGSGQFEKFDLEVQYWPKEDLRRLGRVVTNDPKKTQEVSQG